jgi:hypothetical protein
MTTISNFVSTLAWGTSPSWASRFFSDVAIVFIAESPIIHGQEHAGELAANKVIVSEILGILRNYRIQPKFFCRFLDCPLKPTEGLNGHPVCINTYSGGWLIRRRKRD